jgi:SpoIID/LytB domain protein
MISQPVLHVGIVTGEELRVTLAGEFTENGDGLPVQGACSVSALHEGIRLETSERTITSSTELCLVPSGPGSSFVLHGVTIGRAFHWEQKEDQRFTGSLRLLKEGGAVTAINIVSLEEYLKSVISSEMSATSSLALLKAHAVASRSWLMAQLERSKRVRAGKQTDERLQDSVEERIRWYDREDHASFDVCADDHCQRYQGITKAYTESVRRAVDETRGWVLTYRGEVCDARFSKSCGGVSESFHHVWEDHPVPYLMKVVDGPDVPPKPLHDLRHEAAADRWIRGNPPAFCNTSDETILSQVLLKYDQSTRDFYRWQITYTQDEIADLVRRKSGIDFGGIRALVPVERGDSGRLVRLKIVGTKKSMTIGKELEIRRTLSPSHLYSAAFVVDPLGRKGSLPETFRLRGAGWGHGVGLCQIGAAVMGEKGYEHEQILSHYFSGEVLERRY